MGEILRASLEGVRFESIVQLAEGEMLTGFIRVDGDATLTFHEGRLVDARAGAITGTDAFFSIYFRKEGAVVIERVATSGGAEIGSITELIMDALRLVDEWARLAPMVVRAQVSSLPAPLGDLPPLLDGMRTLAEAVLYAGLPPHAAVDPLLTALSNRSLRSVAPPDEARARAAATPPKPEAYFELIDRGRLHLKEGRLAEAEVAFRQALMARPDDRMAAQNLRRVSQLRVSGGA